MDLGRRGGARERTEGWPAKRPSRWEWTLARRRRRPSPLPRRCRRNNHLPGSHPASGVGASFSVPPFTSPRPHRGDDKPQTGAAGPGDQILCPVAPPRPRRGWGQSLLEGKGMVSRFLCPVPAPSPRRGGGQNLLEAQRKGWYPVFCVFFTAWLPNGYQKRRETIGAVGAAKMVISVWLPNGYQGNFFERKGSLFSCFEAIFQLFWSM